jgi:O-antigen/teichoic acid export membrane protein
MIRLSPRWQRVGHMMLGTGLLQGANVIVYVLLARLLEPHAYGTYRQLFLINQLLWAVGFAAFPTSLLYFAGRVELAAAKSAIVRQHLRLVGGLAIATLALLLVAGPVATLLLNNPELRRLLPVFAVYPAAYMLTSLVAPVMIAEGRTAWLPAFTCALALVNSVPVLLTAWLDGALLHVTAAAAASGLVGGALAIAVILRVSRGAAADGATFAEIIRYAAPLLAAGGLGLIGLRMDQFAVSHLFGPAMFAVYAVGAFELPFYSLVKSSTTSVLLPEISAAVRDRDWNAALSAWRDMQRKNAALLLPVSAALFVFAEDFIVVLFGARYREAGTIFAIFSLMGPVRAITFGLVLRAMGRTDVDFWGSMLFLVVVSAFVFPLASAFGLQAAALTVVLATVVLATVLLFVTARMSGGVLKVRALYPPRILVLYGILILLFEGLRLALRWLGLEPVFDLGISGTVVALLMMILLPRSTLIVPDLGLRSDLGRGEGCA